MKTLKFNNEEFKADKIIKNATDIIGQDLEGNELFGFRGISDLSQFILEEGQTFDIELTIEERMSLMQKAIDDLTLGGAL
jgi:hypothetical protein